MSQAPHSVVPHSVTKTMAARSAPVVGNNVTCVAARCKRAAPGRKGSRA
jgi:hypothetical protein